MPKHDDPTEIEPRPVPASNHGPASITAQLKQDISSGATGDKVAVFDPGIANIGTDAEAAGASVTPEMADMVRRTEREGGADASNSGVPPRRPPGMIMGIALLAAIILGVAAAAFGMR